MIALQAKSTEKPSAPYSIRPRPKFEQSAHRAGAPTHLVREYWKNGHENRTAAREIDREYVLEHPLDSARPALKIGSGNVCYRNQIASQER